MSNKSYRINTTVGGSDKYLKVKLEQDIDTVEILSLNIKQKDIYSFFNANFGVLIGRVIANGGVGIPNAKISIFIPLSDDDKMNSDITALYPYTTPRDKNADGVRYNLLPRVAVNNPFLVEDDYLPNVPVGTFPTKEEVCINSAMGETYRKYYKYTTVTNQAGDYMIYGAPIGTQTVHMSVDVTDIGKYSMTPGTMITQLGYSPYLFEEDGTKIKYSTDLDTLPNVETQEISVDIKPFWGDTDNYDIGITRQDFKIRAVLVSAFTVFGSAFTDANGGTWGRGGSTIKQLYSMNGGDPSPLLSMDYKRIGTIHETIMFVPNTVADAKITGNLLDTLNDYKQLFPNQYTRYVDKGVFTYIIPCNRKKIITDERGFEIEIPNNDSRGVFTEFVGFMVMDYSDQAELPVGRPFEYNGHVADGLRFRFKIPQTATVTGNALSVPSANDSDPAIKVANDVWRKQNYKFAAGDFYSVARFHGTSNTYGDNEGYSVPYINAPTHFNSSGAIFTNSVSGITSGGTHTAQSIYELQPNTVDVFNSGIPVFAVEWLNICLYFPQFANYHGVNSNTARRTRLLNADNRNNSGVDPNKTLIGGTLKNTANMARADLNPTTFIKVPKPDIINIINQTINDTTKLGFRNGVDFPYVGANALTGTDYKTLSGTVYVYKGLGDAGDVFAFLRKNHIA